MRNIRNNIIYTLKNNFNLPNDWIHEMDIELENKIFDESSFNPKYAQLHTINQTISENRMNTNLEVFFCNYEFKSQIIYEKISHNMDNFLSLLNSERERGKGLPQIRDWNFNIESF